MKFLSICALSVALMFSTLSCTSKHLISDEAERALVQSDFDKRAATWNQGDLFKVFEQEMTDQQREALTFLYAYMPLGDITDLLHALLTLLLLFEQLTLTAHVTTITLGGYVLT